MKILILAYTASCTCKSAILQGLCAPRAAMRRLDRHGGTYRTDKCGRSDNLPRLRREPVRRLLTEIETDTAIESLASNGMTKKDGDYPLARRRLDRTFCFLFFWLFLLAKGESLTNEPRSVKIEPGLASASQGFCQCANERSSGSIRSASGGDTCPICADLRPR